VKVSRRKLTLQLTPLLDLMLIVFFLQYLQMREREVSRASAAETVQQDSVRLSEELEAARRVAAESTRLAQLLRIQLSDERAKNAELAATATAERQRTDRLLSREELLGQMVVELFGVPKSEVDQVLGDKSAGVNRTPEQLQELRQRFHDLASAKSGKMIRHLLLYDEIRKRCDVWELFIDAQHVVTVSAGNRRETFRLHLLDGGDPDIPRFENEFFEVYRALPDSKSLVVILLTYDRQARLIVTEAVGKALPQITRRLTDDARGQIRFEYADLGIRVGAE
jgi:hypothetical protein